MIMPFKTELLAPAGDFEKLQMLFIFQEKIMV